MVDVQDGGDDWGEVDGEEEPLFADDLEDDDVPPLSELNGAAGLRVNPNSEENFRGGTGADVSAAGSGSGETGDQAAATGKKRKPLLTLTTDRLFSDKGLPALEKEFPKLRFIGKGHEAEDLKHLLQQYEHWANRLFPKLTFKDVTDRIERLATTRGFKTNLIRMRRKSVRGVGESADNDDEDHRDEDNNEPQSVSGDPWTVTGDGVLDVNVRTGPVNENKGAEGMTDEDIPNLWDANRGTVEEEDFDDRDLAELEGSVWDEDQDPFRSQRTSFSGHHSPDNVNSSRQSAVSQPTPDEPMISTNSESPNVNSDSTNSRTSANFRPVANEPGNDIDNSLVWNGHVENGEGSSAATREQKRPSMTARRKRRLSSDDESEDGHLVIACDNEPESTFS